MKRIVAVAIALISLIMISSAPVQKDYRGHTLVDLWKTYEKAWRADKPKDAMTALDQIKKEARARKLTWDFYEASKAYVDVKASTNWKLREEAQNQFHKDVEALGDPIATFYLKKDDYDFDHAAFAAEHKDALKKAFTPEFYLYGYDGPLGNLIYWRVLKNEFKNDYEYVLWNCYVRGKDSTAIHGYYNDEYPVAAFLEYQDIAGLEEDKLKDALEAYAQKYQGKAVAMLARQDLLAMRFRSLLKDKCKDPASYKALYDDCRKAKNEIDAFKGTEGEIAACCEKPENLMEQLTEEEIAYSLKDGHLAVSLRNLNYADAKITLDGKTMWRGRLENPDPCFYVPDTVKTDIPVLNDGEYEIKLSHGKVENEGWHSKHTLSIAGRADSKGYGVYVADYKTGEPLKSCTLSLLDNTGKKLVKEIKDFRMDGFTRVPDDMVGAMSRRYWAYRLQASFTDKDGIVRKSQMFTMSDLGSSVAEEPDVTPTQAVLITDRSAFNPGETVHFKAVLYSGIYEHKLCPAGVKLTAVLRDAQGNELEKKKLTTGEFGSVADEFVLVKTERGGMYTIELLKGNDYLASHRVRVDEFVLPTFELEWDPDKNLHFPLDIIELGGVIRSYSGHSLSSAKAVYSIKYGGEEKTGDLEIDPEGRFKIKFVASEDYSERYMVTVKVTDGTGETLEFSTGTSSGRYFPLSLTFSNPASGVARHGYGNAQILSEDIAKFRVAVGYSGETGKEYGTMKMDYTLKKGDDVVRSAEIVPGGLMQVDMTGLPSGMYTLTVHASAVATDGRTYESSRDQEFYKAGASDKSLDDDISAVFLDVPMENGIAVKAGTTLGPAWMVAELFGDGNVLLDHRIVAIGGEKGKESSFTTIGFTRKPEYPENLTISVSFFRDGEWYTYQRSQYVPKVAYQLPLGFTRFLDTTLPSHPYSFIIKTEAGVECAAAIFDKSTETIARNEWSSIAPYRRPSVRVYYSASCGSDSSEDALLDGMLYDETIVVGYGSAKSTGRVLRGLAVNSKASAMAVNDAVMEEVAEFEAPLVAGEAAPAVPDIHVRENFANTVAWEPFLRSDKDGQIQFDFTTADKLSTYYVQLFAHDKDFHNSVLRKEMTVTIPVKVAAVQPQFLYGGDGYAARVTLSNNLDEPVEGNVIVTFYDGPDYKTADVLQNFVAPVMVPANGSVPYSCEVEAPKNIDDLGIMISFASASGDFGSDAVFVNVPLKPAYQTISEAHSAVLLSGADKAALIDSLRGMFVNIPGSEAELTEISIREMLLEAIPRRVIPKSENMLAVTDAMLSNILAQKLGAAGCSAEEMEDMVAKVKACQNSDGGFGWFEGMTSSPIVTATVLERFVRMGAAPAGVDTAAAVRFLDNNFFADPNRPGWCGRVSMEQYLYVRSLYASVSFEPVKPDPKFRKEFKKDAKAYLVPAKERGLNGEILYKARRIKILQTLLSTNEGISLAQAWGLGITAGAKMNRSQKADLESLVQYAQPHWAGGQYYPNAVMPFRGLLESELYAHSFLCDLLSQSGETGIADGIRLWLMIQKETQQWEDDPAYVDALSSVFHGSRELLDTKVLALKGSVTRPFEEVKASGNGFTVDRVYFLGDRELKDGDTLHVGDKVRAEYRIWNQENRSFVRLSAPRPAAFRPAQQLSGRYGWWLSPLRVANWYVFTPQGYRSVLADRTEYWFDSYPEEKTEISEEFLVSQEGRFQSPAVEIESLYAPHYRANDDGTGPVTVKP